MASVSVFPLEPYHADTIFLFDAASEHALKSASFFLLRAPAVVKLYRNCFRLPDADEPMGELSIVVVQALQAFILGDFLEADLLVAIAANRHQGRQKDGQRRIFGILEPLLH